MIIQEVSSSSCWKYHVFLSFRGKDTRKNFTDHLYAALKQAGINVFRDDKELERGKEISIELINAIEQSSFSIVVFSRNYASSTWCLDELVKIVQCKNSRDQTVIPIFYDVAPSTVRNQSENFQEAFVRHEEVGENTKKVEEWKTALREIANISGWHAKNWHESELVQQIVKEISRKLGLSKCRNNFTGLVGLDSRLEKLKMLIGAGSDDVRMIGICGMGGIGKTTIARAIFESIFSEFEGSSFVANVREISEKHDLVHLQKQLLSQISKGINIDIWTAYDGISMIKDRLQYRKVLIVLDDVVHTEQLNNLAAKCEWFGSGSRIIITTRDRHLLEVHGVHETYMVEKLNDDEAYELFSSKAFRDQPPRDFLDLIKGVVQYADGLPLALEVLGSFLLGRTIDVWRSALQRLRVSKNEILDKLQISYDGLEKTEQRIFLDIACFYKGEDKHYVTRILDGCDFYCSIGIDVLIDKCLISISKSNKLWMHDLLQDMGHQIVNRESSNPENRSRLWKEEDIKDVLTKNTGTEAIEAIMSETELNLSISAKTFSKMKNLRLLKIKNVQLLAEGLEYLSDKLRVLIWHGYSLKSLPSCVRPDRIVELELSCSPIEQLWKRTTHLDVLTSIVLEDCSNLDEIPDLTWAPNLVVLFILRCPMLLGIRSSLLVLKKLISLWVENCASLMTLPGSIHLESLEYFHIFGCPKLEKFPEIAGRMEHLRLLEFRRTAVREMPSSIQLLIGLERLCLSDNNSLMTLPHTINGLTSLEYLILSNCSSLVTLPDAINGLASLEHLDLSHCSNLVTLPDTVNGLASLEHLDLSHCSNLVRLPDTINGLASLTTLDLNSCTRLENVPESLGEVSSLLTLILSATAITEPVWPIFHMKNLQQLRFQGCKGPPSKSSYLHFLPPLIPRKNSSPMALMLPASSDLCSLAYLDLSDCNLGEIPSSFFTGLSSLASLDLSRNNFLSLPITIRDLSKLGCLYLCDCKNLQYVPELPSCTKLLYLDGCDSFQKLTNAFKSFNSEFSKISCVNCLKLSGDDDFILSVVKALVMVESIPMQGYSNQVVFPGGDIPNWVRYKSEGSSIRIRRPPDLYNNKLVGFIFCALSLGCKNALHLYMSEGNHTFPVISMNSKRQTKSKHIWLLCFPNQWWSRKVKDNHINLSFGLEGGGEVKRCGIHPIYEQDLTDFNPTASQPILNVATTYGNLSEHDNEEPQPKRLKKSSSFWQKPSLSKYLFRS